MAYDDIQDFIKTLEKHNLLMRITAKVDSTYEITEITDRVVKSQGPALLFENIKDSAYPVLINAFGSYERINLAFEVKNLDCIADDISKFLDIAGYSGILNKVKSIPRLARLAKIFPVKVNKAPCQEIIEEPDLNTLPILKCWPNDGGKYITLPIVITKDPETGIQNMGMYRMQVFNSTTTGMHWHLHKDGKRIYEKYKKMGDRMPVSVALGCDPATIYSAIAPLPEEIDEVLFAGFLRKSPLQIVKSITNDIYVPSNAEFILEGYIDVNELREEGPFGDHTGYYSLKDYYPVFHLTCITRRKKPVYPATVTGKPPMEDCFFGKATERIFLPFIKFQCPEIVDINFPVEGVFHNCVIVSIEKRFPGHAQKVMNALWGMGQMMYTKMIVVVDGNIDPHDMSTVAWKVFNNISPERDLIISKGPLDALDHASPFAHYGYRLGVDATKKWPSEGHLRDWPTEVKMNDEIKNIVTERWNEYGF